MTSSVSDLSAVCGHWLWKKDSDGTGFEFSIEPTASGYTMTSGNFGPAAVAFAPLTSFKTRFLMQLRGTDRQDPGHCFYYAYIEVATSHLRLWGIDQDKLRSPKWIKHWKLQSEYGQLYHTASCSKTVKLEGIEPTGLLRFMADNFKHLAIGDPVTYSKLPMSK